MMSPKSVAVALMFVFSFISLNAVAVDAPHYDVLAGFTCTNCHTMQLTLGTTGYDNVCQSCHRPGNPAAGKNPLTLADAADPFVKHSTARVDKMLQTSHRWSGPDTVPAAGALPPVLGAMTSNHLRARTGNSLACVRCHDPHSNTNGKFLRVANDQDQLCLDCHRSRNVTSHLRGSHPVNVPLAPASANFNNPPKNANPLNPTSDLGRRLPGGKIVCSTCHGVHYTDSRSSTFDGASSSKGRYSFTRLSSGDGYLLRSDRRGAKVLSGQADRQNLCTSCHAGKKSHNLKNQDIQCVDCHGAHVEFDPGDPTGSKGRNIFLIRRNVFKGGQASQIFFRYTGSRREYKNSLGTGVCQGCHDIPLDAAVEHASNDPKVCNGCHFHNNSNGSFSGACTACHGYPPTTATRGGPTGLATNALGTAAGAHAKHVQYRSMLCVTCHEGYAPPRAMPSTTIDMGFNVNNANVPGFTGRVTSGSFVGNANTTGVTWVATAAGTTVTTAPNTVTCNVYCHGATLTPPRTAAVSWVGGPAEAACGSCHGATSARPPTTGSHLRHAGAASGQLALACDQCHGPHPDNSHMNGSVKWDLSLAGGQYKAAATAVYAVAGATNGLAPSSSFGSCNVYCHSSAQGDSGASAVTYQAPVWGGAALGCSGCHKDMAIDATASGSHRIHTLSTGANYDCGVCHAGYTRTSAAAGLHANRLIDLAGFNYSQGNSHPPGNGYGSCSASRCHGSGAVVWGGTLWSATDRCGKCHSSSAAGGVSTAAPFYGTSYPVKVTVDTDIKVGAHTSHLVGADAMAAPLGCVDCHGAVTLGAANHMNGTTNFVWSGLATKNGVLTPVYTPASGVCANVYCHGAAMPGGDTSGTNRSPSWKTPFLPATLTTAACGSCHGFPPPVAAGHPAVTIPAGFPATAPIGGNCGCHANINPAGNSYATIFLNKNLHINGSLEVTAGGSCDSCHGYPPASAGFAGTRGNWSSARAENYVGGGGAHTIHNHVRRQARPAEGFSNCNNCHDAADHQMSSIVFLPSQNLRVRIDQSYRLVTAQHARYTSNRLDGSAHLTGTCANISCHFGATPKWDRSH